MENQDLKYIKKHYSETLAHLCRELFPTLLETPGLLTKIIDGHFNKNKYLGQDILNNDMKNEFKNYVYMFVDKNENKLFETNKTPEQLFDEVGYELYPECKSEADIQSFRHYYYRNGLSTPKYNNGDPADWEGEELCTFEGGRLKYSRVWFAVKKNVDSIKREDFSRPQREDEYSTSVLSIQFSRSLPNTLSIKSRYNHSVDNPDATFSNNLENIAPGLTKAFASTYNLAINESQNSSFSLPRYFLSIEGKYYKYNYCINGHYYCENAITDKLTEQKLNDNTLVLDYFVLDLQNKTLCLFDKTLKDSFPESIGKITKINITRNKNKEKVITLGILDGEDVIITLDCHNKIVELVNNNCTKIGDDFLKSNMCLRKIQMNKLEECGHNMLLDNMELKNIYLPNLKKCGNAFLKRNEELNSLRLPKLKKCGDEFLFANSSLTKVSLPNLTSCGNDFIKFAIKIEEINLNKLKNCGDNFLSYVINIKDLSFPSLIECGDNFIPTDYKAKTVNMPKLEFCGKNFLCHNEKISQVNLPNLISCGNNFMSSNKYVRELSLPMLTTCGNNFLYSNEKITKIDLPRFQSCKNNFLFDAKLINKIILPNLTQCEDAFMRNIKDTNSIVLPSLTTCGNDFLFSAENVCKDLYIPSLEECGDNFLWSAKNIKTAIFYRLRKCGDSFLSEGKLIEKLDMPRLEDCGDYFLENNQALKFLHLAKLNRCGSRFMANNNSLIQLTIPKMTRAGSRFLKDNTTLTELYAPMLGSITNYFLANNKKMYRNDITLYDNAHTRKFKARRFHLDYRRTEKYRKLKKLTTKIKNFFTQSKKSKSKDEDINSIDTLSK